MQDFKSLQENYEASLEDLKEKISGIRTGRAVPSLVENIIVEAYGTPSELKTLASISAPEPRQLLIQPFDPNIIQAIEQAINKANLDINSSVDGNHIRLSLPPLTEEKRQELVKEVKKHAEETRVKMRVMREETIRDLKTQQKEGGITEDDFYTAQREIQTLIEEYNTRIDEVVAKKEQEILTV
jgi:ribosome recycling factor